MRLRLLRRLGYELRRKLPQMSLSQRFFWTALAVVIIAMLILGHWTSNYVRASIVNGVGGTAAASIEALVTRSLGDRVAGGTLTSADLAQLDSAFQIGNETEATRLLDIRIRDLAGNVQYASLSGLEDDDDLDHSQAAARGQIFAQLVNLPLRPIGGLPEKTLEVLEIYTPLRQIGSDEIFGVAELYFSAGAVRALQERAQSDVWIIVAMIGFAATGALAVLVDVTGEIIARQRRRLGMNLRQSRRLMLENAALSAASERLRLEASLANEQLLAQVGSDIHDGPVQLLTLLILKLTRTKGANGAAEDATALATESMDGLRAISAGLVLPELASVGLTDAVLLAVDRHESLTGTAVRRKINVKHDDAPINARVCAYRVVQQALNNAYRHAGGTDQAVEVTTVGDWLKLEVTNRPGQGIELPVASSADQIGLRAMRFRVESLGGELTVSFGGRLARVVARIPLSPPV